MSIQRSLLLKACMAAVGLFVALMFATPPAAAQTPHVFVRVSSGHTPEKDPDDTDVTRQQRIDVDDPKVLLDEAKTAAIRLELFPDFSLVASRTRLKHTAAGATWFGQVAGYPDSHVAFVVENDQLVAGHVYGVFGIYRIVSRQQNNATIFMVQQLETTPETTETNRSAIIPFLEGTDVFWTLQQGNDRETKFPYKLEADILPHLVVVQNFTDVLNVGKQQQRKDPRNLKEFSYSISGTPAVRIRMLRENSAPVRTPSYMPRGNFQFLWVRGLKDCAAAIPPPHCKRLFESAEAPDRRSVFDALRAMSRVSLWEAHFIIGHHSNGQEGCLVKGQERESDAKDAPCVPPLPLNGDTINRVSGSFSTNYMRIGMNYSRQWMQGTMQLQATKEARLRVEYEFHPRSWMDPDIADFYGRKRWNLGAAYAAANLSPCRKRIEGSASTAWNRDAPEGVSELTYALQLSCYPTSNGGWGFFARWYHGQDYYNVGFFDNITRLHFGATFNQSGFFRFRRPPPSTR